MPEILRHSFLCLLMSAAALQGSAKPLLIRDVHVAPAFFNPSLHQVATLSFTLTTAGRTTVVVLDRDGVPIRTLMKDTAFKAGTHAITWNGRSDEGDVVADEAWSFKIDLHNGKESETWFPALLNIAPKMVEITPDSWDPVSGILRYKLPFPARVHIQAGSATVDPRTKTVSGPVMRTIVNREPRIAGAVIEQWDGFDESRTIRVTDLPHFVVAIAATPLPECSVITVGNRRRTFVSTLVGRRGKSLLPAYNGGHVHHQGLTAVEDVSPPLKLELQNARWSANEKSWLSNTGELEVTATAGGPTAAAFVAEHGGVQAFIDGKRAKVLSSATTNPVRLAIPLANLRPGSHILAINWGSPYGPVAVNSLRFAVSPTVTR